MAATLAALTLARLLAAAEIPLVPDEAYYWLWSLAPSAGYYDHPPMIAWWIWGSTHLLGATTAGVRLLPILSAVVATVAVAGTARELFGRNGLENRAALWLNATFLVSVGTIFATPDAPSIMFWALSTWALAALRRTGRPWLWIVVGFLSGLGALSKYTNLFFGLGILFWLGADPRARRWLASPWLWAGGAVAIAIFLPNILWNADNHWLTFAKQFGRIEVHGAEHSHVVEFFAGQFGLLNPLLAIFAGLGIFRALTTRTEGSGARFLLALSLPLFVYMCIHSLHARVQGNWPGPLYPAAALLAAYGATQFEGSRSLARLTRAVVPVGFGLSLAVLLWGGVAGAFPLPFRTPADRLIGWDRLAGEVDRSASKAGAEWVATLSYGLNAELAWQMRHQGSLSKNGPTIGPRRMVDVANRQRYGFLGQDPALFSGPALLVVSAEGGPDQRIAGCFSHVEPVGTVERRAGTRVIEAYKLLKAEPVSAEMITDGCP